MQLSCLTIESEKSFITDSLGRTICLYERANQRSYQRSLNEALCVLQTDFRIKIVAYFYQYLFFKDFFKIFFLALYYVFFSADATMFFFVHKKLKKPPQKVVYLWQLGGFFTAAPT